MGPWDLQKVPPWGPRSVEIGRFNFLTKMQFYGLPAVYQIVGARLTYGHRITMYGFFRPISGPSGSVGGPKKVGARHKKKFGSIS